MLSDIEKSVTDRHLRSQKKSRSRLPLPSAKLASVKQFNLLKAFAIASGTERRAVTIKQVAEIQGISEGSVSICNPFFDDTRLIEKLGHRFKASAEVLSYFQRLEWNDPDAGKKLAPLLRKTWFAEALVPRLQMNPMNEEAAIHILSDFSGAGSSEKRQLVMVLDYLELAGVIARDGNLIRLVREDSAAPAPGTQPEVQTASGDHPTRQLTLSRMQETINNPSDYDSLSIPIPGFPNALIEIPKDMESDDWQFFRSTLDSYLNRLQKKATAAQESRENDL